VLEVLQIACVPSDVGSSAEPPFTVGRIDGEGATGGGDAVGKANGEEGRWGKFELERHCLKG
jgi:hypothetical protein